MMLWGGRLHFRQYIKNKTQKYCVKVYELCKSEGVVIKLKIYSGNSDENYNNFGHTTDDLHLLEDYLEFL